MSSATALVFLACFALVTYSQSASPVYGGDCEQVQGFEPGKVYQYEYENIVTSDSGRDHSQFKIKCGQVSVFAYARCSARLSLASCSLLESKNSGEFKVSRRSRRFVHRLQRSYTYFHFNVDKVKAVFNHPNDKPFAVNLKKAILSHLIVRYSDEALTRPSNSEAETLHGYAAASQNYGDDDSSDEKQYTARFWGWPLAEVAIRVSGMPGVPSDVLQALVKRPLSHLPNHECSYKLFRGRLVNWLECEENGLFADNTLSTKITMRRTRTASNTRSLSSRERSALRRTYVKDTIVFGREGLDEGNHMMKQNFDAAPTMTELCSGAINETTPLYGRMERWMVEQNEASLSDAWRNIENLVSLEERAVARKFWHELLFSCVDSKWCQSAHDCRKRSGCSAALATSIQSASDDEKNELLVKSSLVQHPNADLVASVLHMSRDHKTPEWFYAVEKLVHNHQTSAHVSTNQDIVNRARDQVFAATKRLCRTQRPDASELKLIESAVLSSIVFVPGNSEQALEAYRTCWDNVHLDHTEANHVILALVNAIGTSELQTNQQERSRMMAMVSNPSYSSHVKLSAFLAIITSDPSDDELDSIFASVMGLTSSTVGDFIQNFIKIQMQLSETQKCVLSPRALAYLQRNFNIEPLHTQTFTQEIPSNAWINFDLSLTATLASERPMGVPKFVKVQVNIPQLDKTLLSFEAQTGGIQSYLTKLLGPKGLFDLNPISYLSHRPLTKWIRSWFEDEPNLDQNVKRRILNIKHELNFFKRLNEMSGSPFFSLEVFDEKMDLGALEKLFDLTPGQIFNILENIENGVWLDESFHMSPINFELAYFGASGLPVKVHQEWSGMVKAVVGGLIDISKVYFTGYSNSRVSFNFNAEVSSVTEQYVNPYKDVSVGSGVLASVSNQFDNSLEILTTPSSVSLTYLPGSGAKIGYSQALALNNPWSTPTGIDIKEMPRCRRTPYGYFTIDDCAQSSTILPHVEGFFMHYRPYRMSLVVERREFGSEPDSASAYGINAEVSVSDARTGEQLIYFNPVLKYKPERSLVQVDLNFNGPTISFKVGIDQVPNPRDPSQIDEYSMMVNVSGFFGDTTMMEARVRRQQLPDAEFGYGMDLWYYGVPRAVIHLTGSVAQYAADSHELQLQALINDHAHTTLVYRTGDATIDDMSGKNVTMMIQSHFEPINMRFIILGTCNERFDKYHKVIHLAGSSAFFLDGRMEIATPDPSSPDNFKWMATITANRFQGFWDVNTLDDRNADISFRLFADPSLRDFERARRDGRLTAYDVNQFRTGKLADATIRLRFTDDDAAVWREADDVGSLVLGVAISTKPDCDPCGKLVFPLVMSPHVIEATLSDDGRTIGVEFVQLPSPRQGAGPGDLRIEVDRDTKSIRLSTRRGDSFVLARSDVGDGVMMTSVSVEPPLTRVYHVVKGEAAENNNDNDDENPTAFSTYFSVLDISSEEWWTTSDGCKRALNRRCQSSPHPSCPDDTCRSDCPIPSVCCQQQSECSEDCDSRQCDYDTIDQYISYSETNFIDELLTSFKEREAYLQHEFVYLFEKFTSLALSTITDSQRFPVTASIRVHGVRYNIRSIFEQIYIGEMMVAQFMSQPMLVHLLIQQVNQLYMTSNLLALQPHQGAAFVTSDNGQFVTMNGHYHNIPSIQSQSCTWLASTDTVEGAVNVLMKRDSTVYTIGGESVEITMDGRAFWSPDGDSDFRPVNFPFVFKLVTCSKPSSNVIECKGLYSHARFVYYPATGVTTIYGDMRGAVTDVQGAIGFPENSTAVPRYPLPDGVAGIRESDFLNAYELSGNRECVYDKYFSSVPRREGGDREVCERAFLPFAHHLHLGVLTQARLNSYVDACALTASNRQQTCQYTDMLAFALRKRGIPAPSDPACLSCGSGEFPVSAPVTKHNVVFLLSLSEDTADIDPVSTIEGIMDSIEENLNGEEVSYSLITFGGQKFLYRSYMSTFNYRDTSADRDTVSQALRALLFNGPDYHVSSSVAALDYAAHAFDDYHRGTMRTLVLVAPQESDESVGALRRASSGQVLTASMTRAYMLSKMENDDRLTVPALDFFRNTDGDCFNYDQADDLATQVSTAIRQAAGSTMTCECSVEDLYTGTVVTRCHH